MGKPSRPPKEIRVDRVQFLSEQDGQPERAFKHAIETLLQEYPSVLRAYLARVSYGNPDDFNVALCIRCQDAVPDGLKESVGTTFARQFNTNEHLDTLFLREEQEKELRDVCSPFYASR